MTIEKKDALRIIGPDGRTASYQGRLLEFLPTERERAEMILWLVQREAVNGSAYRLIDFDQE